MRTNQATFCSRRSGTRSSSGGGGGGDGGDGGGSGSSKKRAHSEIEFSEFSSQESDSTNESSSLSQSQQPDLTPSSQQEEEHEKSTENDLVLSQKQEEEEAEEGNGNGNDDDEEESHHPHNNSHSPRKRQRQQRHSLLTQPESAAAAAAAPSSSHVSNSDNSSRVEYEEGLPKLLYEGLQSDEAEVVTKAGNSVYKILESLSSPSSSNNTKKKKAKQILTDLIGMGGHTVILLTMRKWPQHSKIQAKGCSCIASLIHHWQQQFHHHREEDNLNNAGSNFSAKQLNIVDNLNKMGSTTTIMDALNRFPKDMVVQSAGISAVTNLCYDPYSPTNAKNTAQKICGAGAIQIVATTMKEFPIHCKIQQLCCWFFRRMCTLGMAKQFAVALKTHALIGIVNAISTFPNQQDINEHGYHCMIAIMKPPAKTTTTTSSSSSSKTKARTTTPNSKSNHYDEDDDDNKKQSS